MRVFTIKTIQVCIECESDKVFTDVWMSINHGYTIEGAGEVYCTECCESTKTIDKEIRKEGK